MEATARLKFTRIAPRKARAVIDMVRNKPVDWALSQLIFSKKSAAKTIKKLIESAQANAVTKGLNKDHLVVDRIWVDGGPAYKRVRFWGRGRTAVVRKRTCHITVILAEKEQVKPVISQLAETGPAISETLPAAKPKRKIARKVKSKSKKP